MADESARPKCYLVKLSPKVYKRDRKVAFPINLDWDLWRVGRTTAQNSLRDFLV